MKLRSILLLLFSLFFQNIFGQVDFKISAGSQWSNAYSKTGFGFQTDYQFNTGFHVNGQMLFNSSKKVQFYTGLGVGTFGTVLQTELFDQNQWSIGEILDELKFKTTFLQVELPSGILFYFDSAGNGLFVDLGIKPLYSLFEFTKSEVTKADGSNEVSRNSYKDVAPQRFNLGVRPGIGYDFQNFHQISVTAFGEFHALNRAANDFKYYQYGFGLSVGIRI